MYEDELHKILVFDKLWKLSKELRVNVNSRVQVLFLNNQFIL